MEFFISPSSEETDAFGKAFAKILKEQSLLVFYGELGSGKTTLIKSIAAGFADIDPSEVTSPTFNYLNIYNGKKKIYHFDLYRLKNREEFIAKGFLEMIEEADLCCIEWPERIASLIPDHAIPLYLEHLSLEQRKISIPKTMQILISGMTDKLNFQPAQNFETDQLKLVSTSNRGTGCELAR